MIEHTFTEHVVCPHCGFTERDSHEWRDRGSAYCDECGGTYTWERRQMVDYTTTPLNPPGTLHGEQPREGGEG